MTSKLVVCGGEQDATSLCNYLLHYERLTSGQEVEAGRPLPPPGTSEACFRVTNKYFSASIQLLCVEPSAENAVGFIRGAPDDNSTTTAASAEGFVLVLSQTEAEKAIEAGAKERGEEPRVAHADLRLALAAEEGDLPVRLLVVLCPLDDSERAGEGEGEREGDGLSDSARCAWVSWACDHGFELVEVPRRSPAALCASHDQREKEGLPRVVEALGSHMWRSGERGRERGGERGRGGTHGAAKDKDKDTPLSSAPAAIEASQSVAASSTTGAGAGAGAGGGQSASIIITAAVVSDTAPTPAASASAAKREREDGNPFLPLPLPDREGRADGKAEAEAEDSEQAVFDIIHQARTLREAVSSGKVSDEERRARAEQMALRFAAMIDLAGEGSDSD